MADVKITKRERFMALIDIVNGTDVADKAEYVEFLNARIDEIDRKASKAKEAAAKKRAESDALTEAVEQILTDEAQTVDEITAQIDGEDISRAKVVARLSKLVAAGKATKEQIKGEDGRRVMAYKTV